MLDLVAPDPSRLAEVAALIAQARAAGPVLVCCGLGYGRSAAAVATWPVTSGRAPSVEAARSAIRRVRPRIAIDMTARQAIARVVGRRG
jgi:protein-tyrosine phosphatase